MRDRIQVVVERELSAEIKRRAARSGASVSLVARDLIRRALEIEEDTLLSKVAEQRWSTMDRSEALSHETVNKRFGLSRRVSSPRRRLRSPGS